jgi:alginate O-acetyltransferase complex protein AlgI
MLFNSPVFWLFFAVYVTLHGLCPSRWRLLLLIVGSLVFYGYWNWLYTGLPLVLAFAAAGLAAWIMRVPPERRRLRLLASVAALLMPLVFFKYTNFLWLQIVAPLAAMIGFQSGGRLIDLGLPLGISFVTFTLIAYVVDTATGTFPHQPKPKWLVGYALFFPHIIAGPILRPHELIPQLQKGMPLRRRNLLPGLALFASGMVKKMIFADQLGPAVNAVYAHPSGHTLPEFLLAVYGFSVQIYCDFSGYTDMALGTAQILGVRLPNNFFRPYLARSITLFWRHWHRTLSYWLRDYVYIPLGGNRDGQAATVRNIIATMAIGGLWHGANWTFLIWGVLHGVAVALNHLADRKLPRSLRLPRWLAVLVTFHFVTLLWIFFRAPNLGVASEVIAGSLGSASIGDLGAFFSAHLFECCLLALFFLAHPWDESRRLRAIAHRGPKAIVVGIVVAAIALSIAIGVGSSAQFIYFEF